jgi:hypothetical protein
VRTGNQNFYGIGKLQILLQPFDNIILLKIAQEVSIDTLEFRLSTTSQTGTTPKYLDMSNMGEIKLVFRNQDITVESGLYMASNSVDLANGIAVFKVTASKINDIRKIFNSGTNVFYVTSSTDTGTTVIYSGTFVIYDSIDNVTALNANANNQPLIIFDETQREQGTAIVTRRVVQGNRTTSGTASSTSVSTTSVASSVKVAGITYQINTDSSLSIDGYTWTTTQLKQAYNLDNNPINLTIQTDTLYTKNAFLARLPEIKTALENKFLTTSDSRSIYNTTQTTFRNNVQ